MLSANRLLDTIETHPETTKSIAKIVSQIKETVRADSDAYDVLHSQMEHVAKKQEEQDAAISVILRNTNKDDVEGAKTKLQKEFNQLYDQIEPPEFKMLFLNLTLLDQSGVMARVCPFQLELARKEMSKFDENPPHMEPEFLKQLNAVKSILPFAVLPYKTLSRFAHDRLPIGINGLVEHNGRYYYVNRIYADPTCAQYGRKIELRSISTGRIYTIPHSLSHSHVRYQRVYHRNGKIVCSDTGKEGYTWKTGCAAIGYDTMNRDPHTASRERRVCEEDVTEIFSNYPPHKPKLALCQALLRMDAI